MFGKSIKLFSLLGFEVKIDLSWLVIAVLIVWSLATGVFPHYNEGLSTATYWWMGVLGALGLFASIIFHELSHSLVARRYGLPMRGITLFIFGGVAEMHDEPPSPRAELAMALAGPASSIAIGVLLLLLLTSAEPLGLGETPGGVVRYLMSINFILAAFNLVPAFPLDGGRVLRAILWGWKKNINQATRIASAIGSSFGLVLILLGVFSVISGAFISGMWWFLIGMFLRNASQTSYKQLMMRRDLAGRPVRSFMKADPVTAPPDITVEQLVQDYVYKHHFKMYPVADSGNPSCVTTRDIKQVPREEWSQRRVRDIAGACGDTNTIDSEQDAMEALQRMRRTGSSRLLVRGSDGTVEGIVSLKDLVKVMSLKMELEEEG